MHMVVYKDVKKTKTKHLPLGRFDDLDVDRHIRSLVAEVEEAIGEKNVAVNYTLSNYTEYDKDGVGEPKKIASNATIKSVDGMFVIYLSTEKKWSFDKNHQKIHASLKFNGKTYKELDNYKTLRKIVEGF